HVAFIERNRRATEPKVNYGHERSRMADPTKGSAVTMTTATAPATATALCLTMTRTGAGMVYDALLEPDEWATAWTKRNGHEGTAGGWTTWEQVPWRDGPFMPVFPARYDELSNPPAIEETPTVAVSAKEPVEPVEPVAARVDVSHAEWVIAF